MNKGYATSEKTKEYVSKFKNKVANDFYTQGYNLYFSSIGIGTYLGHYDEETDNNYTESLKLAIKSGCNFIDTSINYRYQRSERAIGAGLTELLQLGLISRDNLIICTKVGYIPFDNSPPQSQEDAIDYFNKEFSDILKPSDFVSGMHCIKPAYIKRQVENSLQNLQIKCIDIYYLHNPEQQLDKLSHRQFFTELENAFVAMEDLRNQGKIRYYGTATWNGYRLPENHKNYLSLEKIVNIARKIGGNDNGFKFIQLPLNLAMTEAVTLQNQRAGNKILPAVYAAKELGISVITSAPLLEKHLLDKIPIEIKNIIGNNLTPAQCALQFTRSCPNVSVTLVGMNNPYHVEENLALKQYPKLPKNAIENIVNIEL